MTAPRLSNVGDSVTFEIVTDDAPACGSHRRRTAARCERLPDHEEFHAGRDTAGRWHIWEDET